MFVKSDDDDDAESVRQLLFSIIRNSTLAIPLSTLDDALADILPNRDSVSGDGFPLGQGSRRMGRFEEDA